MRAKFELGELTATPGAMRVLGDTDAEQMFSMIGLMARHEAGDWGTVGPDDAKANDEALKTGERILSAYTVNGVKLWVITEADRSVTTVLLPEEY